jgi:predicted ATP-dependent serine protease
MTTTAKPIGVKCKRCGGPIPTSKITCIACGAVHFGANANLTGRVDDGIKRLSELVTVKQDRIVTDFVDRNWGTAADPGIAVTGVTLLGGMPGAGKSTLCAQILSIIGQKTGRPTLFVGAEENGEQVKARAIRLALPNLADMLILTLEDQSNGYKITRDVFDRWKPAAFVLDSIQKYARSDAEQLELAGDLKEVAVKYRCPVFIVSQVNKDEEFSGSNGLQHEVDTLVIFSLADELVTRSGKKIYPPQNPENPDQIEPFRALETKKNRNGERYESYFTMSALGLSPFTLPAGAYRTKDEEEEEEEDEEDEEDEEESPPSGR